MCNLYQVNEIQKLEEIAIKKHGVSVYTLMQRAGKSAFDELKKHWPKVRDITVVCGSGNNAGDGYEVASLAKKAKLKVKILQLVPYKNLKGAAKKAALKSQKLKITTKPFNAKELEGGELIVDAILGTGVKGEVKPHFKKAIVAINKSNIPVFALDLPSGIDADTGRVLGEAINARVTITFIGEKIGLFVGEARDYCGEIICNDLMLPKKIWQNVIASYEKLDLAKEKKLLKPRKKTAHKGDFGHVLVVGGDLGMSGAARLAAEAALRVGAGLVSVATRKEHATLINITRPEIMAHGISSAKQLKPLLDKVSVIIIGPGLGIARWGKGLFNAVIKSKKPLVVDADALNILATKPKSRNNWILTPHPGEAARLLGTTSKKIQLDRLGALKKLQKKFGGVCVLKGSGTLIAAPGEKIKVCDAGNPGMASAGMGDVLSGIIGGLLGSGLDNGQHRVNPRVVHCRDLTPLAVLVHALAGDQIAKRDGELGMLAMDLIPEIRKVFNRGSDPF